MKEGPAYRYDGTYDGMLCCVFEAFERHERPARILSPADDQLVLFSIKEIETDDAKAARVRRSIPQRISQEVADLVESAMFSCDAQKELIILDFLRLGFRYGPRVINLLANETVCRIQKIVSLMSREAHLYIEFIRFSIVNGVMTSIIEPQNIVLPHLQHHFCSRFGEDAFMIFDKTHGMALVHLPGQTAIIPVDNVELPQPDEQELEYRALWKLFYDTIAIKERYNPRCRMSHMPKKYWKYMTEFSDQRRPEYSPALETSANRRPSTLIPEQPGPPPNLSR